MEKVGLIHIDIHHVIPAQRLLCDIILNGFDPVIHKKLFAVHGPRKSPDTVIHCYDIRIKGTDQIVQGGQWGNLAAGSHVDIDTERGKAGLRMVFRISVDRHMALI